MFGSVLVANRGEIACRVIATLRRLGVRSVAVYSAADAGAKHVREADAAVPVGEPPPQASYLDIGSLVAAARGSGAEAVHPGYGFLAENAAFARAVLEAGLGWVGPPPEVLELTGDKLAARAAFEASGFPILPAAGPFGSAAAAAVGAAAVGFPLMVKAVLGGGGIGMGVAQDESGLASAVETASAAAGRLFADPSVYLEQYLPAVRHVEVQLLFEAGGRGIHLHERECSVQRRHQKVVEEAPSQAVDAGLREGMIGAALRSMASIGYVGAGTVECLVAAEDFFFLEVNARLQVEHPVTEETCGVDLVEEQLRIAAGEGSSLRAAPTRRGHAVECRIYAEHPETFLPSPGRLARLRLPEGARCDFGYDEGDDIPMFYDPLVGKVVTLGADRASAIEQMRTALEAMVLEGPRSNVETHLRVLRDERFLSGNYDTRLLEA